jgi:predicted GIY-YIG superfamily endonuclease
MNERHYSTYIVASRSRTLYIGMTGDLRRRVFQHKWKEFEGFSAKYNCATGLIRALSGRCESDCSRNAAEEVEPREEDYAD